MISSDEISNDVKLTIKHPQVTEYPNDNPAVILPYEQKSNDGAAPSTPSGNRKGPHKEEDCLQGGYKMSVCDNASIHSVPSVLSLYSRVQDVSDCHENPDTAAVFSTYS